MSDAVRARPTSIRLDRWTVTSGSNVNSRAAVVIRAAGHDWKATAEGNGAVDALFKAVDMALGDILDGHPALLEYDVHALAEGPDAEGRVSVVIGPPATAEGARSAGRFSGEVTSTNIVAASVEAYMAALEGLLAADSWAGATEAAGSRRTGRGDATSATPAEFDDEAKPIDTVEWFNR